jgi:hypothetical protein
MQVRVSDQPLHLFARMLTLGGSPKMARHSAFNKVEAPVACGVSLLPFRTTCKGPVNTGKVGAFDGEVIHASV